MISYLKKYKRYAPDTMQCLENRSEIKFKVTVTQLWYATLCHSKMHPHAKFEIPTSNDIRDMLWIRLFCEFTHCVCNSLIIGIENTNSERHNEDRQISGQNSSFSKPIYIIASKQQDTFYTNDN